MHLLQFTLLPAVQPTLSLYANNASVTPKTAAQPQHGGSAAMLFALVTEAILMEVLKTSSMPG